MKKILLLISLLVAISVSGQITYGSTFLYPDSSCWLTHTYRCSNNYEMVFDSSSKKYIRIDLDAVEFAEWVNDYWVRKRDVWVNKRGEKLTAKKLWLYWYKETNACWWE